ncbi:MAG: protein kinase [Candidatus Riflebacteria bacterium]|nr:protein kinase [Candidatus Riflebacteria bacterium]
MAEYTGKRAGNFTILNKLGDGGFATVYLAQHTVLEKKAAVKFLLEEWINEPDVVSRFFDEARTMERLKDHPNIVGILDIASKEICDKEGLPPYFIMQYVNGVSLESKIHGEEGFTLDFIYDVAKAALSALAHCHKMGVIHRDIKPSNILIDVDGRVLLTDFGIAKAKINTSKTGDGLTLGSTDYMSPEQALGKRDLDHRSDIYSFGVTMYELVVGKLPFIGDNPNSVALMHIQEPARPPIEINDAVPPRLNDIIMKAMEKRREDRYQTPEDMLEAFQHVNDPEPSLDADVKSVDLTKATGQTQELPEDSLKNTEGRRKNADPHVSRFQASFQSEAFRGVLKAFALVIGFTLTFLGGFKGYQVYTQAGIDISSFPPGAQVDVNGQKVGTCPIALPLTPGIYKIKLSMPDYIDQVIKINLQQKQKVVLNRSLKKPDPEMESRLDKVFEGIAAIGSGKKKGSAAQEAWRKVEATIDEVIQNEDAHLDFLKLCERNGCLASAAMFYKSRVEREPKNALLMTMWGKVQIAKNDLKAALDTLTKAWELDTNSPLLLNALGDYFLKEGNKQKAKQYYEISLDLNQNQPDITSKMKGL